MVSHDVWYCSRYALLRLPERALSQTIPVAYIFRAKNYYGMKDQQDVVVQAKNIFGADVDRQEIERRLSEEVVVEDTTEDAKTE